MSARPCPVCGSPRTTRDPFYYHWLDRDWHIARCRACTHQFVDPPVGPAEQARIYSDAYFAAGGDWGGGVFTASYAATEDKLRAEAREVLAMLPAPRPGARLLDIGCAGGVFLNEAQRAGYTVTGIEPNRRQAIYATRVHGIPVLNAQLEDTHASWWPGEFSAVTLLDVLEHVPDPLGALTKIAQWLAPGGTIFIRGPLHDDRLARFKEFVRRTLRIRHRLPGYPLDANHFNPRSMQTLLTGAGFGSLHWHGTRTAHFANLSAVKRPRIAVALPVDELAADHPGHGRSKSPPRRRRSRSPRPLRLPRSGRA